MIRLNIYQAIEALNLSSGMYSPLDRFMFSSDQENVLSMDFPVPVFLTVDENSFKNIDQGTHDLFFNGLKIAEMEVEEKSTLDPSSFAEKLFKSKDHPGYSLFVSHHTKYVISGKVIADKVPASRKIISDLGWKSVSGFQTRNVPHIGHERVQKHCLEHTKGLLLTPVLGVKNPGDFKNELIESAYKAYVPSAFPNSEAILFFIMLNMRYLGPREAVFHAIVRRNLGCTHFVVGRDHAGVGSFYGPYDAQELASSLDLGIEIIKAQEVGYCASCSSAKFRNECEHEKEKISGTYIRKKLSVGENPLPFLRKEVFEVISTHSGNMFVNDPSSESDFLTSKMGLWIDSMRTNKR